MNRDETPFRTSSDTEAESEAAAWIARRDRGFTAGEQDEFFQWLARDPRHGEWLARHQRTVAGLDLLVQWRPHHAAHPNPDLLATARRRPKWIPMALLAAAAVAVLGLFIAHLPPPQPAPFATALGFEQRVLEDGSVVELNRGAAIDVRFTSAERRVRLLAGEAHFTVSKNPLRPFIVQAASIGVRAVGTAFDVSLESAAVSVLVTEGRVQVRSGSRPDVDRADPLPLAAGQLAVVPLASGAAAKVRDLLPAEVAQRLAWEPRELNFDSASLRQVVEEFNRHNRIKMVIADPSIASIPIGATIRSDNIGGFVRLLDTSFGIAADWRGNDIYLRRSR